MFKKGNKLRKGLKPTNAFEKGHIPWNKNKKCPNISKSLTGKIPSKKTREKLRKFNIGKKLSEETKRKIGEYNKKIGRKPPIMRGENHPNWKGGITPENKKIKNGIEFRLWREAVFARDNWTCQKCNIKGSKLNPHHIKNFAQYPELRMAINNGITLCRDCHIKFHKIYGRKNNTKEQLEEFLKNV